MLDLVLHFVDLALQLRVGVVQDDCGNDVTGNAACSSEVGLLANIHVGHVLVFAEEWQVENDLKGLGVGSQYHEVSDSTVQTFCGLVGTLLKLLVSGGLVAQVNQLLLKGIVSLGPCAALGGLLLGDDLLLGLLDNDGLLGLL